MLFTIRPPYRPTTGATISSCSVKIRTQLLAIASRYLRGNCKVREYDSTGLCAQDGLFSLGKFAWLGYNAQGKESSNSFCFTIKKALGASTMARTKLSININNTR